KIDFRNTDEAEQTSCAQRYGKPNVKLLADRVESHAELDRARKMGYTLFQGAFFCKPQELARKEIPTFKLNYLRILRRVNQPEIEFHEPGEFIRADLCLSLKLARYGKSGHVALSQ